MLRTSPDDVYEAEIVHRQEQHEFRFFFSEEVCVFVYVM